MPGRRKLKGGNLHKTHLEIAESLSRQISEIGHVAGIVFMGGLARGFADSSSDIDIVVILDRRDGALRDLLERLGRSESARTGLEVDLEVHAIQDFVKLERTDWRRREYSEAEIIMDRDGTVQRAISEMLAVADDFWTDRIVKDWMYLQWYACPKKGTPSIAEIWLDRGDPVSAHYCLNYSIELLVELLYALDRQFVPVPKWRLHHLWEITWRPRGFSSALTQLITVKALSGSEALRRVNAMRRLHVQMEREVFSKTDLSRKSLFERFLEKAVFEKECGCRDLNPGLKLGKLQS